MDTTKPRVVCGPNLPPLVRSLVIPATDERLAGRSPESSFHEHPVLSEETGIGPLSMTGGNAKRSNPPTHEVAGMLADHLAKTNTPICCAILSSARVALAHLPNCSRNSLSEGAKYQGMEDVGFPYSES